MKELSVDADLVLQIAAMEAGGCKVSVHRDRAYLYISCSGLFLQAQRHNQPPP